MKKYPNVAVKLLLRFKNQILMLRHKGKTYDFPGGRMEWKESITQTLERELIEELGVLPEIGKLLYINTFLSNDKTEYVEFFFEVKNGKDYLSIDGLERTHAHELAEIIWISPSDDINMLPKQFDEDFKNNKIFEGETKFINELDPYR